MVFPTKIVYSIEVERDLSMQSSTKSTLLSNPLQSLSTEIMNLYILNDVLYDYTPGMCVIAAESLEQCNQIFIEEFGDSECRQKDLDTARVKVIEGVNHPVGVVAYEYGGG